jgi:hypothetical protein
MGYGSYSHDAHVALTARRAGSSREAVFTSRGCHPLMDPKGVRWRECRDSADHPATVPIAFALDVTGSMGDIPDLLARSELPTFMKVLGTCGVDDPQLLFVALGDATCDQAPLQVGQFEATAELMDQWLTYSYLEGGGGGQNTESYELALYFLAEHTVLDSMEQRGRPGYLFMTGDELPYPAVSRHQVEALIGDRLDDDVPTEQVVAAVARQYRPFFLIPDLQRRARCEDEWRRLLGDHVIAMEAPEDTCYVASGIVAISEGKADDLDALARLLSDAGTARERVAATVRALTPYAQTLGRDAAPPAQGLADAARSLWRSLFGGT